MYLFTTTTNYIRKIETSFYPLRWHESYYFCHFKKLSRYPLQQKQNMHFVLKQALFIALWLLVNVALSTLMIVYDRYSWYLVFISLGNLYKVIFIFIIVGWNAVRCFRNSDADNAVPGGPKTIGIVIPCYTESKEELARNLDSLNKSVQRLRSNAADEVTIVTFIVVDGTTKGKHNDEATFRYVEELTGTSFSHETHTYVSWKGNTISVAVECASNDVGHFVCLCKHENMGKKDSLILVRDIVKHWNAGDVTNRVERAVFDSLQELGVGHIEYIVGTDADTRFDDEFLTTILADISSKDDIVGVSGYALPDETAPGVTLYNPIFMYQAFEYHLQQGLTRYGQSLFGKVTCLPGCGQVWRADDRTLGTSLNDFKQLKDHTSILQSIRALLGEDRRYTGLVLYRNASAQTLLSTRSKVYTSVPIRWPVFFSQRRRWFLSSQVNNIRDTLTNTLPLFLRFVAFTQLWNSAFIIVNLVALAKLFWALHHPTLMTWIAIGVFGLIFLYKIALCIRATTSAFHFLYLLCSAVMYSVAAPCMNLIITCHAFATMTDFDWGATQHVDV